LSFVFPTHVGMNRGATWLHVGCTRFPHTRGDEPFMVCGSAYRTNVFPTHVGMNLSGCASKSAGGTFSPHTWGWTADVKAQPTSAAFSPHTWGWTTWVIYLLG